MNVSLICAFLVTQKLCEVWLYVGKAVSRNENPVRFCLEECSVVLDDASDVGCAEHIHLHTS